MPNTNLTDMLAASDPGNPNTVAPVSIPGGLNLSDIPRSQDTNIPKFKPASQNIVDAWKPVVGAGDQGALSRLSAVPGALWHTTVGAFGLPQEAMTRLMTGNEYAIPSDVPALQNMMPQSWSPSARGITLNLLADPLNLALVGGAATKMLRGALMSQSLYKKVALQNEIAVLTRGALAFNRREDAVKLMQAADVAAPVIYDAEKSLWVYDLSQVKNAEAATAALQKAKEQFTLRPLLQQKEDGTWAVDIMDRVTGEGRAAATAVGPLAAFRTPEKLSPAMKTVVQTMYDARYAQDRLLTVYKDGIGDALAGTSMLNNPRNDLSRAMVYELLGVDMHARDAAAYEAISAFGVQSFMQRANLLRANMKQLLPYIKDTPAPPGMLNNQFKTIGEMVKAAVTEEHGIPLPPELIKAFSAQSEINANSVNLKDVLMFFGQKATKESQITPAVEAIRNMIGYSADKARGTLTGYGTVRNMTAEERKFGEALLDVFTGKPSDMDLGMIDFVTKGKNKDLIRWLSWGSQETKNIAATGARVETGNVARDYVGRLGEELIHKAEKRNPILTEASQAARGKLYAGLLGMAFDSSVRNLSSLLTTVTELGVGRTLEGMGMFLKDQGKWREWLRNENVIHRTNSMAEEIFANTPWKTTGEKVTEMVMSPFVWSENFVRGSTFLASMLENLNRERTVGQAIEKSIDQTRNLMFGHSVLDMSPYMRNPVSKMFMQFVNYPLKNLELFMENMTRGGSLKDNMALKYIMNMGMAIGYGQHIGVDPAHLFISGVLPTDSLAENISPQAPVLSAAAKVGSAAVDFATGAFTNDGSHDLSSPASAWRGLGDVIRMLMPTGRYTMKTAKELIESGIFSDNWDTRRTMAEHPNFFPVWEALGIRPDPGVDGYDRFIRMIGFKSQRDVERKDLMQFLHQFSINYSQAREAIGATEAENGDVASVRQRWISHINGTFGARMEKYNVPKNLIEYLLMKPVAPATIHRAQQNIMAPAETKAIQGMAKPIKDRITLPAFAPR